MVLLVIVSGAEDEDAIWHAGEERCRRRAANGERKCVVDGPREEASAASEAGNKEPEVVMAVKKAVQEGSAIRRSNVKGKRGEMVKEGFKEIAAENA